MVVDGRGPGAFRDTFRVGEVLVFCSNGVVMISASSCCYPYIPFFGLLVLFGLFSAFAMICQEGRLGREQDIDNVRLQRSGGG